MTVGTFAMPSRRKRAGTLLAISVALAGMVPMATLGPVSHAKESVTILQGVTACKRWCDNHRRGNERSKCRDNCERYWACNGRDSTAATCRTVKEALDSQSSVTGKPTTGGKPAPTGVTSPTKSTVKENGASSAPAPGSAP